MHGWYKSRKWSELTFTDLDKSYHNDENQSEEFAHSENVLDPRRPAHTAAVHPGEEYYTDTQTQLQSLSSLDRIKGTLLISVTSSDIVSMTQFSTYRPERFLFSISYTCTVSLCAFVCECTALPQPLNFTLILRFACLWLPPKHKQTKFHMSQCEAARVAPQLPLKHPLTSETYKEITFLYLYTL